MLNQYQPRSKSYNKEANPNNGTTYDNTTYDDYDNDNNNNNGQYEYHKNTGVRKSGVYKHTEVLENIGVQIYDSNDDNPNDNNSNNNNINHSYYNKCDEDQSYYDDKNNDDPS